MNELLGARGINTFMPLRAQEHRRLLGLLSRKALAREPVNLTGELLRLTNNVMSRMILGEAEDARDLVRDATKMFGEFNVSDFVWVLRKVDLRGIFGFGKRVDDLFKRWDSLVERIISRREHEREHRKMENDNNNNNIGVEGGEIKSFLDVLLDCMEDQTSEIKINRVHIKGLILEFFIAGADTTATATEWALVELINHPKLLHQARQKIHDVVGDHRLVEESDGPNLPFLQAVVKETFRLHPPVPLLTRRCVSECAIKNYVIPKNTLLFVNVWAIGRDPNHWESPLDFRPERFLKPIHESSSVGLVDVRGQHFQLLPFGSGRRMCPGVALAMQEVPALLGAIIQCFDFQVVGPHGKILKGEEGVIDVDERPGVTVPRANDMVCVPMERPICGPLMNLGES